MKTWLVGLVFVGTVVFGLPALGEEAEDNVSDELSLQDDDDFPDLVRADETGGVMDELALLEEEMSAGEVSSASKHRQSIFWSPSAITVLGREEIRNSGAAGLTDLLRRIPGFDIYELKVSNPLVGARALTEDANNLVLLLIDGREAMLEVVGFAYWAGLTISLAEIERIEVIRGPGSTLYGANAFAAVVSITTLRERIEPGADFSVSVGQEGHEDTFARVRGRFLVSPGVFSWSVGLGSMNRVSVEDPRDQQATGWRSHGYIRYQLADEIDLSLHAGTVLGDVQNYFHMGEMRLIGGRNFWLMAKSEFKFSDDLRLRAQVYHTRYSAVYRNRGAMRAYDVFVADIPDLDLTTPTVDGQLQLDYQLLDNMLLICGGNLRHTRLSGQGTLPRDVSELRGAGFIHAQWHPWEFLQVTGGLRLDLNSETEPALSPRAVLVFRLTPDHSARLGYARAFRKPSFFERNMHLDVETYNSAMPEIVDKLASEFGYEDLVNERVHSFEAGWRSRLFDGRLNLALDLFYNIYQDTIYFYVSVPLRLGLPDIANGSFHYENQEEDIHALGGELEISARLPYDLVMWGNLHARVVTDTATKEHLPGEPSIRFNLGGGYHPGAGIQLDLGLHYVSAYKMPLSDPENVFSSQRLMDLGDKALVIGRAGYRLSFGGNRNIECGMQFRIPLGNPFREYAGIPVPDSLQDDSNASVAGSPLHPWFTFYLRGSY